MGFMAVDISGSLFSILSLAFKEKFDIFASVVYAVVIVSLPFFVHLGPTHFFAFAGHGYGHRDRRPHLESHRKTQTGPDGGCRTRADGRRDDRWFWRFDLLRET